MARMFEPDRSGPRIGPFWITPGWTRGNAGTVWLASFFTIGLAAFMSFMQPYLLTEVLKVPQAEQGRLTGSLGFLQELVVIALAGFIGAWSDRVGRRRVFYLGFLIVALGYFIYPFAGSTGELVLYRLVFGVGIAMTPLMLSACVVDAIQEPSRGKWIGSNNLLQGLGVIAMSLVLARTPAWFAAAGADPVTAGRYAYWTAAGVSLIAALAVAVGLPRPKPAHAALAHQGLLSGVADAARAGFRRPRLALAYGSAFIGRGDFTVIGAFFSLWITQEGLEAGLSTAASLARGGMLFGILQGAAMAFAFCMGIIVDRVNRVTALCLALSLAGAGYLLLGRIGDPFAPGFIPVALLVGMGEVSVIVASGALLGQEAPLESRGPVVGLFNAVGGVGILFATAVGGYVFDHVGRTAPFTLMALLNLALFGIALSVRLRAGQPEPRPLAPPVTTLHR
jgi:MFS family permease